MGRQKSLTYGEIADAVLPSVVFTVDVLNTLCHSVDAYVKLAPRDRQAFFQEQMQGIWKRPIDWTSRPRTSEFQEQWVALKRYFKEQGRIRGPATRPDGSTSRKWTGVRACGVVFKESIDEMVFLGTGMRPGDRRGYIGQRMKCRTVLYWKLPQSDRTQLKELAKDWQGGGPPTEQKMEAYYRRFHSFVRNVHMTALREFGQHLVTLVVPEPGLTNPPRLYEFMHELKILEKPLVKTVPVGDTLRDIYLEVNHAAGRIEGAALPAVLNKKSRLKRKTTWSLDEGSFIGHDEIILKAEEFDEELFYREAIAMVYLIVRMAHSNISAYRDLDPPWSSFESLVDDQYLLPHVPMRIPTSLLQPNCFLYLKHWFTVTKGLKFNLWQRKNSLPSAPVPLNERWWAASLPNHVPSGDTPPPDVVIAMDLIPPLLAPAASGTSQDSPVSPFGSAGGAIVHSDETSEQDSIDTLDVPAVSDPEDRLPDTGAPAYDITGALIPPCAVPSNGEARGQWCMTQLREHCALPLRSTRVLRSVIQKAVELPMIPNSTYPLKSAAKRTRLPDDLRWSTTLTPPELTSSHLDRWMPFLTARPWAVGNSGQQTFTGSELLWAYILGWVLYVLGYAAEGGRGAGHDGVAIFNLGHADFTSIFSELRNALDEYSDLYQYPGWAPSVKYALTQSRSHYLAYLLRNEEQDVLLPLLRLVTRMKDGPIDAPLEVLAHSHLPASPSWITDTNGVPSWQWQRCGLPPASHQLPSLPATLFAWFKRTDLLCHSDTRTARSRETGLAILLKVALIFCDLENIEDSNWTGGAAVLEHSVLAPHVRSLKLAIADWANEEALRLEPLLEPEVEDDDGDGQDVIDGGDCDLEYDIPGMRLSPAVASTRQAVSDVRPEHLNAALDAVDLHTLESGETVGDYRTWLSAQPRTAVQELSRKGLQGIAHLAEKKRANRALRAASSLDDTRSENTGREPAMARTSGGWQDMPDIEGAEEDTRPPKKKRRLAAKGINHPEKKGPAGASARRRALTSGQRTTAGRAADSGSSSESELGFWDDDPFPQNDRMESDDEMPLQISSRPSGSAFRAVPVTFSAASVSSGMDIDSDDLGSAISVRATASRRLAFVAPDRRLAASPDFQASKKRSPYKQKTALRPVVQPRPSARSLQIRNERRNGGEGTDNQHQTAANDPPEGLRRSRRLNRSA